MSSEIAWFVELAVRPGRGQAFRALSREMTAVAAAEEGTLVYERLTSGDGARALYVYERYASSAAAVTHLIGFNARFAGLVWRERFLVLGTPSAELRKPLAAYRPRFLERLT